MKKNFALFVALSVLFAFSSVASAFTLAEHEKNIEQYVQALNKFPDVIKTYCEMDGTVLAGAGALGGEDTVRYVQSENDFAIELRPVGGVIELATQNPAFKLPDGSGVGDPIERVMKVALIPGDYRREEANGLAHHIWLRDGKMTLITESEAIIVSILFFNTVKMKGVTMNDTYTKTLAEARDAGAAPGGESAAKAEALPSADSELNDSTDAKVINSYPLKPNEKNTLGIQHRGAYKLYSEKKYKEAYAAFSKLANDYDVNYLSAYWAGVSAQQLKKNDEARDWFERALAINPNYNPARNGIDKLDGKKAASGENKQEAESDSLDEFLDSLLTASFNFQQGDTARITFTSDKGEIITQQMREDDPDGTAEAMMYGYQFYQSAENVAIMHEDSLDSIYVFFSTRDKSLNFAGGIKVGGPISAALAPGVIPGKYALKKQADGNLHTWEDKFDTIQISEKGGKVANIVWYNKEGMNALPEANRKFTNFLNEVVKDKDMFEKIIRMRVDAD